MYSYYQLHSIEILWAIDMSDPFVYKSSEHSGIKGQWQVLVENTGILDENTSGHADRDLDFMTYTQCKSFHDYT